MSIKKIIDFLNEKSGKGKKLTLILIVLIIAVTTLTVIGFVYAYNRNVQSAYQFEKSYQLLVEFEDLNQLSRVEMKDKLINNLDQILEKYPNTSTAKRAMYYKGHVYYYTGEYEEAEKLFEYYTKKNKNYYLTSKAYYLLAHAKFKQQKIDEAIEVLQKFEKKMKKSHYTALALYRIANFYELKDDKENAIKYYQLIVDDYNNSSQQENAKNRLLILKNNIQL